MVGMTVAVAVSIEYTGHGEVLAAIDYALSEKWRNLWKWYIGSFLGLFGGLLLAMIVPFLGVLAMLAAAVTMLVVSVLKIVYLYQSAKVLRGFDTVVGG